ncbi:MAG: VWA domain-containing protein [Rubrobacteraceae bacterium]
MSFEWPVLLLSLVLVPVLLVLYVLAQKRRMRYAVRFTNLDLLSNLIPESPGWRRHLPPALFLLALAVLLVGLARPQATVLVPREEANVVLAMDTSGSMEATDVSPDRLTAAREAAETFLDRTPDELRVGLVTFDSRAQTLSGPTAEHGQVTEALGLLESGGGTAMGDGLLRALETSQPQEQPDARETPGQSPDGEDAAADEAIPAAVILLSDGTNTTGEAEPLQVATRAQELDVPVFTVALGTPDGVVQTPAGVDIPVPPDEVTLRRVAEETGGEFFASTSGADLVQVYEELGSQIGFVEEQQEITVAFVAAALALLLVGGALSMLWFRRLP